MFVELIRGVDSCYASINILILKMMLSSGPEETQEMRICFRRLLMRTLEILIFSNYDGTSIYSICLKR